jgi:hypothetical protein
LQVLLDGSGLEKLGESRSLLALLCGSTILLFGVTWLPLVSVPVMDA